MAERRCPYCGNTFRPTQEGQRFCPPTEAERQRNGRSACSWRWHARESRKRNGRRRTIYACVCVECGVSFTSTEPDAKYCSTDNDSCLASARGTPAAEAIRRAIIGDPNGRDVAAYKRALLADPCVYCGRAADVLDHIVPSAAGGENDWPNLAPSCTRCNNSKWRLPLLLYLGIESAKRMWEPWRELNVALRLTTPAGGLKKS